MNYGRRSIRKKQRRGMEGDNDQEQGCCIYSVYYFVPGILESGRLSVFHLYHRQCIPVYGSKRHGPAGSGCRGFRIYSFLTEKIRSRDDSKENR